MDTNAGPLLRCDTSNVNSYARGTALQLVQQQRQELGWGQLAMRGLRGAGVQRQEHAGELDKRFSYTDASSFAVMERLGIGTAFGFDRDFAQYGFRLIGPGAV